ncbi:hypothetical protein MsAg5_09930 [Methanosarcinaceae archaeon Ag5]|uniref:Uncharacterized protein n=1 Tax=Methanolapillus africanus TaxID=3028297 RepID=A0AAE4MJ72_9EURY|nr:hypothetical protein [Methanosarcinaceae archaeon Ag5]
MEFWTDLHDIINKDVLLPDFYMEYGRLADVGIKRGEPFPKDEETKKILLEAGQTALGQMMVEALCSDRPDRLIWNGKNWEWVALIEETGF